MDQIYRYIGKEELEASRLMPNYNRHIACLFFTATGPVKRALDFGAGIGNITREYYRLSGVKPTAVDLDPEHRAVLAEDGFDCVSALEDLGDRPFDAVISSNVLEHIDNDEGTLRALQAKLTPNGVVAMWVPALNLLWTPLDDRVGHVRRYSRTGIISLFERAGFEVRSVRYHDSLGFFLALIFKVIGDREGRLNPRSMRVFDKFIFPVSRVLDRLTGRWFGKNLFIVATPKIH